MLIIHSIIPLLGSIILIAVSVFILFKDWRSQINRYFLFYNIIGSYVLFTIFLVYSFPDSMDPELLNKYNRMFTVIFFAGFLAVSMVFPKTGYRLPFYRTALIMAPAFAIGVLIIITDPALAKAYFTGYGLIGELDSFYSVSVVSALVYFLIGTAYSIRKYMKLREKFYSIKIRMHYFWIATVFMAVFLWSIAAAGFYENTLLYIVLQSIAILISGLSLFYKLIEYNMLDIKAVVYDTAMYFITFVLASALIWAVMFMYERGTAKDIMPVYLASGFIVLVFVLLSINGRAVINSAAKKGDRASGDILNNLLANIANIKDIKGIIRTAADTLFSSFPVKCVFAYIYNKDAKGFELFYSKGAEDIKPVEIGSSAINWLERSNDLLYTGRIYTYYDKSSDITEDINHIVAGMSSGVMLPLFNNKEITGMIFIREKDNGKSYKTGEIRVLQRSMSQANISIADASAYEEWSQGQMAKGIMDLSSEILSKAIPLNLPKIPDLSFGAFYIPRYREGIDYFDFFMPTKIGVGVIATEISGRGINNSIYSVILRSAFHSCVEDSHSTFITMQRLNKALHMYTKGQGGTVKAYYFHYNINTMRLAYTNAGYQPLEIYRVETNSFEPLDVEGAPLGADLNTNYGMGRTNLLVGDIGFLYSKALIDSKNKSGEDFGLTQLRGIIKENRRKHPTEITGIVKEEFSSFIGSSSPASNILVIIFKV